MRIFFINSSLQLSVFLFLLPWSFFFPLPQFLSTGTPVIPVPGTTVVKTKYVVYVVVVLALAHCIYCTVYTVYGISMCKRYRVQVPGEYRVCTMLMHNEGNLLVSWDID